MAEDSSVFDYDSHYDAIQDARAAPKRQEKTARESRYIASLLEKAEERRREQDVLYERRLAKERAAEDHLFGDKEKFVTAAYKKKLEEDAKWAAARKKEEEEEERNAVEKKGHMGDFYRHLFRSNVAFGAAEVPKNGGAKPVEERDTGAAAASGRRESGRPESGAVRPTKSAEEDIMPERRAEMERNGEAGLAAPVPAETPAAAARREEMRNKGKDGSEGARGEARQEAGGADVGGVGEAGGVPGAPRDGAARRNKEDEVAAARERYLARKRKAAGLE